MLCKIHPSHSNLALLPSLSTLSVGQKKMPIVLMALFIFSGGEQRREDGGLRRKGMRKSDMEEGKRSKRWRRLWYLWRSFSVNDVTIILLTAVSCAVGG